MTGRVDLLQPFTALSRETVLAIADAAEAAFREEQAEEQAKSGGVRFRLIPFDEIRLKPSPTWKHLHRMIRDLPLDAMVELEAIMWIGRGDYPPEDFADAVAYARDSFENDPGVEARYVAEKECLHEYLRQGPKRLASLKAGASPTL
jgi:hypothetical protein